jgi:hypothetical protein
MVMAKRRYEAIVDFFSYSERKAPKTRLLRISKGTEAIPCPDIDRALA